MNNLLILISVLLFSVDVSAVKTEKGTLRINAVVRNNTCSVSSASQNIAIDMGAEATKLFYQAGTEARENPFDIILENCGPAATGVKASLTGSPHAADLTVFSLNNPQASVTAKNIGIAVYDMYGKRIEPGKDSGTYVLNGVGSNGTVLRFVARYISTAIPVTAGKADGSLIFTLTYD